MKISPKPLSGFIELTPKQQKIFDDTVYKLEQKLITFGFLKTDLSVIERQEVLLDEGDENETQKQIYLFEKGENKLGLRFDATVGFARFVAGNAEALVFPFRRYQIGKNFRGERPQKGRYREFYQVDFDIINENNLDSVYEFEIINLVFNLFNSIKDMVGDFVIKVGSRKILNEVFNLLDLDSIVRQSVLIVIDKKAKISEVAFKEMLEELIGADKTNKLIQYINQDYKELLSLNSGLDDAVNELKQIEEMLKNTVGLDNISFDLSIVRGLGYYTGVVFETYLRDNMALGSVCGGGRYDNLADKFTSRRFLGVGGALGISRLIVPLLEEKSFYDDVNLVDAVVVSMDGEQNIYAQQIAEILRKNNVITVCDISSSKFKKKLETANKLNAKFVIICGEDEQKTNTLTLKNMKSGENEKLNINDVIVKIGK